MAQFNKINKISPRRKVGQIKSTEMLLVLLSKSVGSEKLCIPRLAASGKNGRRKTRNFSLAFFPNCAPEQKDEFQRACSNVLRERNFTREIHFSFRHTKRWQCKLLPHGESLSFVERNDDRGTPSKIAAGGCWNFGARAQNVIDNTNMAGMPPRRNGMM